MSDSTTTVLTLAKSPGTDNKPWHALHGANALRVPQAGGRTTEELGSALPADIEQRFAAAPGEQLPAKPTGIKAIIARRVNDNGFLANIVYGLAYYAQWLQ